MRRPIPSTRIGIPMIKKEVINPKIVQIIPKNVHTVITGILANDEVLGRTCPQ